MSSKTTEEATSDRERLAEGLRLRRKVATKAGWKNFFIGEIYHELWGRPPMSNTAVIAPHYEKDIAAMLRLLTEHGIPVNGTEECSATDLCNLFISRIEDRIARQRFPDSLALQE